jgi:hypothetical protein
MQRFVPAHFNNPFGLLARIIKSGDPAAIFTLYTSLMSGLALPIDLLFEIHEKKLYRSAPPPKLPIVIVTGPARSGTSLVAQTLIEHLPVEYISNLAEIFQCSPITAKLVFGRFIKTRHIDYKSFYGKTRNISGHNDALHIWDRWFGANRTAIPADLSNSDRQKIEQFFGAYENCFKKPLVTKNNSISLYAALAAGTLKTSRFICVLRDPLFHAQSLLKARYVIHGDPSIPYGLHDRKNAGKGDCVKDVCAQIAFNQEQICKQRDVIGRDRFWIISYEKFCESPHELVMEVGEKLLDINARELELIKKVRPFRAAKELYLDKAIIRRIQESLAEMGIREID